MTELQMQAEALRLADVWAHEVVRCEGVVIEPEQRYALADEQGYEVATLDGCAPDMQRAVRWLVARGWAHLGRDYAGEVVVLHTRRRPRM